MTGILIREATTADIAILRRFEQGVIAAERPFDGTLKNDPIQYYDLDRMLTAPHIYLVVAELDGEPIGSGYARIEEAKPYLQHAQHAYLGFMYTLPAHRGKGVNKLVITRLTDWSRSKGITEMRLDVYYGNLQAIHAYEKVGFLRHMIEMRAPID